MSIQRGEYFWGRILQQPIYTIIIITIKTDIASKTDIVSYKNTQNFLLMDTALLN